MLILLSTPSTRFTYTQIIISISHRQRKFIARGENLCQGSFAAYEKLEQLRKWNVIEESEKNNSTTDCCFGYNINSSMSVY
jgi:hypothetical protein